MCIYVFNDIHLLRKHSLSYLKANLQKLKEPGPGEVDRNVMEQELSSDHIWIQWPVTQSPENKGTDK